MLSADAPLDSLTFVAFDTETTGTGAGTRVVELAGVRFRCGEEQGRFSMLIDPEMPIPAEAIAVHKITDDMVRGQTKAGEALAEFFGFAEGAVLVAHNAAFDAGVLGLELTRLRRPAPRNEILDSLKAARRLFPGNAHSLDALIGRIGLPPQDARHRALADAELVRHLVEKMVDAVGGAQAPASALLTHTGRPETLASYVRPPAHLPYALQILEHACRDQTKVNLHLDHGATRPQQRIVQPRLTYDWSGTGWLEAFCPDEGTTRCFRIDRILKAEPGASSGFLF